MANGASLFCFMAEMRSRADLDSLLIPADVCRDLMTSCFQQRRAKIIPCVLLGRTRLGKINPEIIFKRKLLRSPRTRRAMAMHSRRRKLHTHDPLKIAIVGRKLKAITTALSTTNYSLCGETLRTLCSFIRS